MNLQIPDFINYTSTKFAQDYDFTKEIVLGNFGKGKIFKKKKSTEHIISFIEELNGKTSIDKAIKEFNIFQEKFRIKPISSGIGVFTENKGSIKWTLSKLYKFSIHNLKIEYENRLKAKKHFSEGYLWNILLNVLMALDKIYRSQLNYNSLSMENVLLGSESPFILFTETFERNFHLKRRNPSLTEIFLSPEEVKALEENQEFFLLKLEKCDIYCLGILILQLAGLRFYHEKEINFDSNSFTKEMVSYLSETYNADYLTLSIEMMVEEDPDTRYNIEQMLISTDCVKRLSINSTKENKLVSFENSSNFDLDHFSGESLDLRNTSIKKNIRVSEKNQRQSKFSGGSIGKEIYDLNSPKLDDLELYHFNSGVKNTSLHEYAPFLVKQSIKSKQYSFDSYTNNQLFESLKKPDNQSEIKSLRTSNKNRNSSENSNSSKKRVTFGGDRTSFKFRISQKLRKSFDNIVARIMKDEDGKDLENLVSLELDDGKYYGQFSNNMKHGKGLLVFSDGSSYVGDWDQDEITGYGYQKFPNEDYYEGNLVQGRRENFGIYVSSDNNYYKGNWKDDLYHGKGIYYFADYNETYEGNFLEGKKHGNGTYTYSTGDVFNGFWVDDKKMGEGEIIFADGCVFQGTWLNDYPNGEGMMVYKNGDKYTGTFRNGRKTGMGVYEYKSGEKFEGEFDYEKPKNGIYIYNEHERYEGDINFDVREGYGEYNYASGEKYKGEWKNNQKNGRGKLTFKESKGFYEGMWRENLFYGEGFIKYLNGDTYKGSFKDGKKSGIGEFKWVDGRVYSGRWENNQMNGTGIYIDNNGSKFDGIWENGKLIS